MDKCWIRKKKNLKTNPTIRPFPFDWSLFYQQGQLCEDEKHALKTGVFMKTASAGAGPVQRRSSETAVQYALPKKKRTVYPIAAHAL